MRKLFAVLPLAVLVGACNELPTASDPPFASQLDRVVWSEKATPARIISFGDSHSDLGNLHAATGGFVAGPPYFEGRWTNGPSWVEELASQLGVPAVAASLAGGTGFAWGGAQTGPGTVAGFIPNVGEQIEQFLGQDALAGDELLVIWAGTNDGIQYVLSGGTSGSAPGTAVMGISKHILDLEAAGGRLFLVSDLHSLALSPYFAGTPNAPSAETWTREFNKLLRKELKVLARNHDVRILSLKEAELIEALVKHPWKFGLTDATHQACDGCFENYGGIPVPNPDDYLWWDAVHFTRVVHRILGVEAARLVLGDADEEGREEDGW